MKNKLSLVALLGSFTLLSQNIVFTDGTFKSELLAHGITITGQNISVIDVNGDNEISFTEAQNYSGNINLTNSGLTTLPPISEMDGIEYFTNIQELTINNHHISSLDLSNNISLKKLSTFYCGFLNNLNLGNIPIESLEVIQSSIPNVTFPTTLKDINIEYISPLVTNLDFSNCVDLENLRLTRYYGTVNLNNSRQLQSIFIQQNLQLNSLNLSSNVNLKDVNISYTNLTALDLSNKNDIENISISFNDLLTSLNVTNCINLSYLYVRNNQLTDLNLTTTPIVSNIQCQNNKLTKLNLANGNNQILSNQNNYRMDATGNPDLKCINIDYGFIPQVLFWNKDITATYSYKCIYPMDKEPGDPSLPTLESFREASTSLDVYPNPSKGIIYVKFNQAIQQMNLLNINGELISSKLNGNTINMSNLKKGMYLLEIRTENKIIKRKIIKE
ncbi:T9SS type A sorting domain-containing protein [Tenacibaculum sp. MEBiC06402]|uniref:T9SS type A sorting domain-containing protein n=1 Tax=unclassified Tenacibaculum TaxID=2635139 RepID=UPI003B99B797